MRRARLAAEGPVLCIRTHFSINSKPAGAEMGLFSDLLDFGAECLFLIGTVIAKAATSVRDFVRSAAKAYTMDGDPARVQRETQRFLKALNNEQAELLRKGARDRTLSDRDQDRLREIEAQRAEHLREMWASREQQTARKIVENPSSATSARIVPDTLHVLQYHVGQTTLGKPCPKCGLPMILQFPRNKLLIDVTQIYWACIGYYSSTCKCTLAYRFSDAQLLSPEPVPEFQATSRELATIYGNESVQKGVAKRMREHICKGAEDYTCPVHGEPLVLREKRDFKGALDQFFLSCPRWAGKSPAGCTYLVKIKSPAQLAAVLRAFEGNGLL